MMVHVSKSAAYICSFLREYIFTMKVLSTHVCRALLVYDCHFNSDEIYSSCTVFFLYTVLALYYEYMLIFFQSPTPIMFHRGKKNENII